MLVAQPLDENQGFLQIHGHGLWLVCEGKVGVGSWVKFLDTYMGRDENT
jgi:hypothetical protein